MFNRDLKIDEVREAADIVEVVAAYVNLARAGGLYKGLCPFHHEKTPSFTVSPNKGIFHCFGCGVGGDVFKFLMMIQGVSFPEALRDLAGRYGVELGAFQPASGGAAARAGKAALYEAVKTAQKYFQDQLWSDEGASARQYLAGRGLDGDMLRRFELGLSRPDWHGLGEFMLNRGFGEETLLAAGLIKTGRSGRPYDAFRDRIIIPIFDLEGRPVAFGGRAWRETPDQGPKYLNSPETPIYKKGRLLYGHHWARPFFREAGWVFLVEGYFDLIALAGRGLGQVAATLGTALTSGHLNLLRGQVSEIVLLFDADEAGQRAAARALPLVLNAEMDARVLTLPQGHDPDSFVREKGPEALLAARERAVDLSAFYVERLKQRYPGTLAGLARAAREAGELLAQVPDTAKSQLLRNRLADLLGVAPEALNAAKTRPGSSAVDRGELGAGARPDEAVQLNRLEAGFMDHLIRHPEIAGEFLKPAGEARLTTPELQAVYRALERQHSAEGLISPERLASGPLSSFIARALASGRAASPEEAAALGREYWNQLTRRWIRKKGAALSAAIREAQKLGDAGRLGELLREKNKLLKA